MLLTRFLGKKPTKRQMEMLHFYMVGFCSIEELAEHMKRKDRRLIRQEDFCSRKPAAKPIRIPRNENTLPSISSNFSENHDSAAENRPSAQTLPNTIAFDPIWPPGSR